MGFRMASAYPNSTCRPPLPLVAHSTGFNAITASERPTSVRSCRAEASDRLSRSSALPFQPCRCAIDVMVCQFSPKALGNIFELKRCRDVNAQSHAVAFDVEASCLASNSASILALHVGQIVEVAGRVPSRITRLHHGQSIIIETIASFTGQTTAPQRMQRQSRYRKAQVIPDEAPTDPSS